MPNSGTVMLAPVTNIRATWRTIAVFSASGPTMKPGVSHSDTIGRSKASQSCMKRAALSPASASIAPTRCFGLLAIKPARAIARRRGASDLDDFEMRQRPHHASSLPNDQREPRPASNCEHENPAQFPMQAEFYSLLRNCNSARFHGDFSQWMPSRSQSYEAMQEWWPGIFQNAKPALRLQREIALANIVVGFQILDASGVDDLAFVDDGGMARQPKAEMHVLFRDQNRGTSTAQLP